MPLIVGIDAMLFHRQVEKRFVECLPSDHLKVHHDYVTQAKDLGRGQCGTRDKKLDQLTIATTTYTSSRPSGGTRYRRHSNLITVVPKTKPQNEKLIASSTEVRTNPIRTDREENSDEA